MKEDNILTYSNFDEKQLKINKQNIEMIELENEVQSLKNTQQNLKEKNQTQNYEIINLNSQLEKMSKSGPKNT